MESMRLLLVDDHVLFREGLCRLLAAEPGLEIAGDCGTAAEALDVLKHSPVDIVLLDSDLGDDHGSQFISSARRMGFSGKILMVTAGMTARESSSALQLGASGIFLKHDSPGALVKAIRTVAGGQVWVDPRVVQNMAAAVQQGQ